MKTILLNLDRSADRLALARQNLRDVGMEFTRQAAVDGQLLDLDKVEGLDQAKAVEMFTNPLRAGEVGCYLSHLQAIKKIASSDHAFTLVLEDDFLFHPRAKTDLAQLETYLAQGRVSDWDVITLAVPARKVYRRIKGLKFAGEQALARAYYFPVMAQGTIWSRKGAARFVRHSRRFYEPVDVSLQRLMCNTGRGLAFRKGIMLPTSEPSVIESGDPKEMRPKNHGNDYRRWRYKRAFSHLLNGPDKDDS